MRTPDPHCQLGPHHQLTAINHAELAVLISQPAAHLSPTVAQASDAAAEREADILRQRTEYKEWTAQKALQVKQKFAAQIDAKRKERQNARASTSAPTADSEAATFTLDVPAIPTGQETTPPPAVVAPAPKADNLDSIAYTITIQPSSTELPWYDTDAPGARFETLEDAATAGVWNYPEPGPRQILQESRCRVFEELWRKGHYLGVGLRFGGDFLVYPGKLVFGRFCHRHPARGRCAHPLLRLRTPADLTSPYPQVTRCGTTVTSRSPCWRRRCQRLCR